MPPFIRNLFAVLAGIVVGVVFIAAGEAVNGRLHPLPSDYDPKNIEMMKHYVATLPASALLVVLLSYAVGFFSAVFLATKLAANNSPRPGTLLAAFFGAASVMNLMAFPHPAWFWLGNLMVLLGAAWCGMRLGLTKATR